MKLKRVLVLLLVCLLTGCAGTIDNQNPVASGTASDLLPDNSPSVSPTASSEPDATPVLFEPDATPAYDVLYNMVSGHAFANIGIARNYSFTAADNEAVINYADYGNSQDFIQAVFNDVKLRHEGLKAELDSIDALYIRFNFSYYDPAPYPMNVLQKIDAVLPAGELLDEWKAIVSRTTVKCVTGINEESIESDAKIEEEANDADCFFVNLNGKPEPVFDFAFSYNTRYLIYPNTIAWVEFANAEDKARMREIITQLEDMALTLAKDIIDQAGTGPFVVK